MGRGACSASLLTTWVTFVPCFLFIFLGAPYVERLRGNRALSAALTGITAAVVGVIANLACYFALHTLFADTHDRVRRSRPTVSPPTRFAATSCSVGICAFAVRPAVRMKWSVLAALGSCALVG